MTNSRNETPTQPREILDYFLHNPQAADSLEGVARWRLMDEIIHRSVDEIGEALDWLVAKGFLIEESSPGAAPVFRLNHRRVSKAKQFLESVNDVHRRERKSGAKP